MAKYLVETYYTCSFKVSHYLDEINEADIQSLEKREDGKFEILDLKLDNRKTKNLDKIDNNKVDIVKNETNTVVSKNSTKQNTKLNESLTKNFNEFK